MRRTTEHEAALQRLWYRWTTVVGLFARQRRGRRRIDAHEYARLYAELLVACHRHGEEGSPEQRQRCERLRELVLPWMSLRALATAERDILEDLWLRCLEAEREIGGHRWRWNVEGWTRHLPTLLFLTFAAAVLVPLTQRYGPSVLRLLEDTAKPVLFLLRTSGNAALFAVAALAVVVAGIYLVWRVARG
jgi:hypothetical protein